MKVFDIDYKRLVRLLTPNLLRQSIVFAFLDAMIKPIKSLHYLFILNRSANSYRLGITPQVCYLEKMLNDRFDNRHRRIYIIDGTFYESTYLYTNSENINLYAFTEEENKDLYFLTADETGSKDVDFIVFVPLSLDFNEPEMKALLEIYKLASKTYAIKKD